MSWVSFKSVNTGIHYAATSGEEVQEVTMNKDDILEWDPELQRWSLNTNKMKIRGPSMLSLSLNFIKQFIYT